MPAPNEQSGSDPIWAKQREWIEICESVRSGESDMGALGYDPESGETSALVTSENVRDIQEELYERFGKSHPSFGARIMLGQIATNTEEYPSPSGDTFYKARSFYQAKVGFGDVLLYPNGRRSVQFYDLPDEPEAPVERPSHYTKLDDDLSMREMVSRAIDSSLKAQSERKVWEKIANSDEFKARARQIAEGLMRGDTKPMVEAVQRDAKEDALAAVERANKATLEDPAEAKSSKSSRNSRRWRELRRLAVPILAGGAIGIGIDAGGLVIKDRMDSARYDKNSKSVANLAQNYETKIEKLAARQGVKAYKIKIWSYAPAETDTKQYDFYSEETGGNYFMTIGRNGAGKLVEVTMVSESLNGVSYGVTLESGEGAGALVGKKGSLKPNDWGLEARHDNGIAQYIDQTFTDYIEHPYYNTDRSLNGKAIRDFAHAADLMLGQVAAKTPPVGPVESYINSTLRH